MAKLKKIMGYRECFTLIVGSTIGSGIFKSPTSVLKTMNCFSGSLTIWALCGLFACLNSIAYLDLSVIFTASGGEYHFIKTGLGNMLGFLYVWSYAWIAKPSALAIMTITAGDYINTALFGSFKGPDVPSGVNKQIAILIVWLIALVNLVSPKLAVRVQEYSTYGAGFLLDKMYLVVFCISFSSGVYQYSAS